MMISQIFTNGKLLGDHRTSLHPSSKLLGCRVPKKTTRQGRDPPQPHPKSPSQRPGCHRNTPPFFWGGGCYSPLRSPKKRDDFNRKIVFQPSIFRGYVSFFLGVNLLVFWSTFVFVWKIPQERSCKGCWMDIYQRTGIVFWKISLWMWRAWRLASRTASVWTRSLKASGVGGVRHQQFPLGLRIHDSWRGLYTRGL